MSIQIMADVFRLRLEPGPKLVLLALANYSNDKGLCWPTQATIARDASLSERQVRRVLQRLEAEGWVEVAAVGNGRGKSSEYMLPVSRLRTAEPDNMSALSGFSEKVDKADICDTKADICADKGGHPTSDQPPIQPPYDPPRERSRAKKPKADLVPLTDDERAKLVTDFAAIPEVGEVIDLALSHPAHLKYPTNQYGYVRNWLRSDLDRRGTTNGRTTTPRGNPPNRHAGWTEADIDEVRRYAAATRSRQ